VCCLANYRELHAHTPLDSPPPLILPISPTAIRERENSGIGLISSVSSAVCYIRQWPLLSEVYTNPAVQQWDLSVPDSHLPTWRLFCTVHLHVSCLSQASMRHNTHIRRHAHNKLDIVVHVHRLYRYVSTHMYMGTMYVCLYVCVGRCIPSTPPLTPLDTSTRPGNLTAFTSKRHKIPRYLERFVLEMQALGPKRGPLFFFQRLIIINKRLCLFLSLPSLHLTH
jgi:hypothetical protein